MPFLHNYAAESVWSRAPAKALALIYHIWRYTMRSKKGSKIVPFHLAKICQNREQCCWKLSQTILIPVTYPFHFIWLPLFTLRRKLCGELRGVQRRSYLSEKSRSLESRSAFFWRILYALHVIHYYDRLIHHMPFLHQACMVQSTSPTPSPYLPYLEIQYASKKLFNSVLFSKNA